MKVESAEAAAKVGLLTHLRGNGLLRGSAIISELAVEKWARRADIVTVGSEIVCYEVKSKADRLTRLSEQLSAYSAVFDRVYAVVATKHMNAAMSRVPSYVGLKEVVQVGRIVEVRHVRDALPSPDLALLASLQLLPVTELTKLIRSKEIALPADRCRAVLVELASELPLTAIRAHLRNFLRDKHRDSSAAFAQAIGRRRIKPDDLAHLSIWQRVEAPDPDQGDPLQDWLSELARARAFGTVPDDIRSMFTAC